MITRSFVVLFFVKAHLQVALPTNGFEADGQCFYVFAALKLKVRSLFSRADPPASSPHADLPASVAGLAVELPARSTSASMPPTVPQRRQVDQLRAISEA